MVCHHWYLEAKVSREELDGLKLCPWWFEARDPPRPVELLAGINTDRNCRRKTARRLQEASPVDLGTRNVDVSSFLNSVFEKIESSYTLQRFLCCFEWRPHLALSKFDSPPPALSQRLLARCVWCFDILFFKDFQHPISPLCVSPPPLSSISSGLADQSGSLRESC